VKIYAVGSRVIARLYDGRQVEATVKRIDETVAGRKVSIAFGPCAFKISAEQIVRVLK
jgi:hypothetical protein